MKVIINGRFFLHRITGVERYAREILFELDNIVQPGEIEIAIPPEVQDIPVFKKINIVKVGKLKNQMWEHISFPRYVKNSSAVSLNLCNVAPLCDPGIVCIHDMKIKAHPEYFSKKFLWWYRFLFENETKRAKKIITVSEFSKKEIIKYYGVDADRIVVVPNAWQHYERVMADMNALEKYKLKKEKYFFAMGSMEPNKNFKWIAETAKNMPNDVFAIAGSINEKVFAEGLGFECPKNMKLLGYVSDGEAKMLMKNCQGFLFPTCYEGFGIPPLEAISAGCKKVYVSDTEVMHEIFEDNVNYINLEDYWIHKNSINNIENNREVLNKYSWKKSAEKIYGLVQNEVKRKVNE